MKVAISKRRVEMEEQWKPIEQTCGMYEVSNMGRVRSLARKTPRMLVCSISSNRPGLRYCRVELGSWCRKRVHQLVVEAFVGPIPDGHEIDHINGETTDNRLENLRIVTRRENHQNRRALANTGHKNIHRRTNNGSYQVYVDRKYVGTFQNIDDAKYAASQARQAAGYIESRWNAVA